PDAGRPVPAELFEDVMQALFRRERLVITYHGRRRDDVSEREISPQRLTGYRDRWYLDAWCHRSKGLRSFALERIRHIQRREEESIELPDEEIARHFDQAFGIFSGPAEHEAVLRFSPEAARWAADEVWHAGQRTQWLPDGRFELSVPFGRSRELVMEILRYGADIEVVAPDFLRSAVSEQLEKALGHYY
ncbi:MAG TPA: WYL domain-containing protein, partial [Wenzhouxiangella sp.]|nr:WYL domain-containing protein [Wenzhouxiangella sp.]